MNPVELYKKLPKKNCGKCAQKACMSFALAVIKGDAGLAECPYMTTEAIGELQGSFTQSDWREELILKLREEVKGLDFSTIADGIGAGLQDGALTLNCLGREFSIRHDGEIETSGHTTPWIKILLLHYIRTAGKVPLSGRWVSYRELRSGMVKYSSFQRECEEPLRDLFDKDADRMSVALCKLGAVSRSDFPTDRAWHLHLLPRMPAIVLYWPKEEEFASKAKILFDATADKFLDVESIMFLLEGFVKNLEKAIYS